MNGLKTILLVEDNGVELTLETITEYRLAYEIVVVNDGAKALEYLYRRRSFEGRASGSPAVVFLGLKVPKVDGLTVLKTIKADPALKRVPVVMLTSSREERDLSRAMRSGSTPTWSRPRTSCSSSRPCENSGMSGRC
jgi:CheY-like chemotaxis protein